MYPNATVVANATIPFSQVATNQFGLNETQLQPQSRVTIGNASQLVPQAANKPWPLALEIEYANRCVWAIGFYSHSHPNPRAASPVSRA